MAVILVGGCRVSNMREGEPGLAGTLRVWSQIGRSTGAQAISLRVLEFGSGLSPGFRNADLVRLRDRRAVQTGDRWYRVLVDERLGSTQVTQFVGSIPPGRAPDHFHDYEEVLFILRGVGRMWTGNASTPIAPGSCIYLPKRQVHCVENTGGNELRLLGVFYPAGSPAVRYET